MNKPLLHKNQKIGSYSVQFFLKKGRTAQTYRVKSQGALKILKLFIDTKPQQAAFDQDDSILEIELLKQIKHPNIIAYCGQGTAVIEQQKYSYVVCDFISGETLADKIKRE